MQELSTFISNHPLLSGTILALFILLTIVEFFRAKRKSADLSPQAVTHKMNRENAVIIDLRPNDLYKNGHIIVWNLATQQRLKEWDAQGGLTCFALDHTGTALVSGSTYPTLQYWDLATGKCLGIFEADYKQNYR